MKGLFFDLDDTLFDRAAAFARWARARHGDDERLLAELITLDQRGRGERALFAAAIGTELERFAHELAEHVEPEAGVAELVKQLAFTHRVAVVTNGGAAQREKLRRSGLEGVVHAVFVSGELGIAKPDRAVFERVLAWAELPARECMFIGDDPERDLAPAAALGMATCWRVRASEPWPDHLPPPSSVVHAFHELREVLAS